jgi:hypothetical protein
MLARRRARWLASRIDDLIVDRDERAAEEGK